MLKTTTEEGARTRALARLSSSPLLAIIAGMTLLVPLLTASTTSVQWHGLKSLAFEIGAVLLVVAAAWSGAFQEMKPRLLTALRGPALPLALLLLLAAVSAAVSTHKAFAVTGLLQLAGGALVCFVVGTQVRSKAHYELLADALIAITAVIALLGFTVYGEGDQQVPGSLFSDHQLLGAFLMLMLPLMLMLGFAPTSPKRRGAAQVTALLCGTCLLLSQTRSSWIGAAAGIVLLLVLAGRYVLPPVRDRSAGARRQRALQYMLPTVLVMCILVLFVGMSNTEGTYAHRAQTMRSALMGRDNSFQSRLQSWHGALGMIRAKPLTGWGIGSYALYQNPFTHVGRDEQMVLRTGPSLSEQAHDFYLQLAAELGLPGLLLWIAFIASFLIVGIRAVKRQPRGSLPQRLLIAALAGVSAQAVDAVANPAWQFNQVTLFLWVIIGLGIAACAQLQSADETSPIVSRPHSWAGGRVRFATQASVCTVAAMLLVPYLISTAWACSSPCYVPCEYALLWCGRTACYSGQCYSYSCYPSSYQSCQAYESCDNGKSWQPINYTKCTATYSQPGQFKCTSYSGTQCNTYGSKPVGTLSCQFTDGGSFTCSISH